jgi:hypothetical protein
MKLLMGIIIFQYSFKGLLLPVFRIRVGVCLICGRCFTPTAGACERGGDGTRWLWWRNVSWEVYLSACFAEGMGTGC